jgi:shikimate dehydrogenase
MYPNDHESLDIDFDLLSENHYLYDLIYNPEVTNFLKEGIKRGAKIRNGLEMLYLQAEGAWEIWSSVL